MWTSSNPSVISCTPTGKITGIKEGQATITVKAIFGDGEDSITVYCAKRLSSPKTAKINRPFAFSFYIPRFYTLQTFHYNFAPYPIASKVDIKGTYGSYFYIEFVRNEKRFEGFMTQSSFNSSIASNEVFKQLSRTDLDAYVGINMDYYKVTTNYKGEVKWKVSNPDIINFDSTTGKVYCKKPGIATISATADGKTLTCTVHSIYVWPQNWTGAANRETCVYKAVGNTYIETSYTLSAGEKFTVKGDMGDSSGWAYGVDENGGWGYIPISHISTKNTVSFYNNLNWGYPLQDQAYNYIKSPYSPRKSRGDKHRGFDISTGENQTNISGQTLVAPFDGTVIQTGYEPNKQTGCGYYICLMSDDTDPVTGQRIVAIYQHMNAMTKLMVNDKVKSGKTVVGYVGTTGASTGPHLHFEINNMNAIVGDDARKGFDHTINPIYFYMDKTFQFNMTCSAVSENYGFYWYNENIE